MDEISPLFKILSSIATAGEISDDEFKLLEFFEVRLYSKTWNTKQMNQARRILFSRDNKVIENIPPTKEALRQHALRSVLQSSKWWQYLRKDNDVAGVLQGDTFAPYIFTIKIAYDMRQAIGDDALKLGFKLDRKRSTRPSPNAITDFDFADDIVLATEELEQAQDILHRVQENAA